MNNKVCYVVMPYGGSSQEKQDHFELVFQLIIKNPLESQGYQVIREDHLGQPGDITRNIMRHLAEGALVVADISEQNWNVAYELGVRHALVRSGTIILSDDETKIPFDISNLKVVLYSKKNPINRLKSVQDEMILAARHHEEQQESDNVIHDIYPFAGYMVEYLEGGDLDLRNQLNDMTEQLQKLKKENGKLRNRLAQGGLAVEDGDGTAAIDIEAAIDQALGSLEYSGNRLIYRLRDLLSEDEPDYVAVGELLKKGLTVGQLSEANFRSLYRMFRSKKIPQLTGVILEVAAQRFPNSLDFKSYLADVYSDSYQTSDKALRYANEVLQVSVEDGAYTVACRKIDSDQLAGCMNAYIGLSRYDLMVEVCSQLLERMPQHRAMLLRNLAVAYREQGETEKQVETLKALLKETPMSDTSHWRVAQYYAGIGDSAQKFRHIELASALDPEDLDYLFALAGHIMDYHEYDDGGDTMVKMTRDGSVKAMLPFLMRAMTVSTTQATFDRCKEFLIRNNCKNWVDNLLTWVKEGMEERGIEGLDYTAVEWVISRNDTDDEELCTRFAL